MPYSVSDPTIFKQDYGGGDLALILKVEDIALTAFYTEAEVAKSYRLFLRYHPICVCEETFFFLVT